MVCPQCSYTNSDESVACVKCATPLPSSDHTLATSGLGWSVPAAEGVVVTAPKTLGPGTVLGERYEIVKMLGQGGMGAVYHAHDRELEREVALKVIRSDMAANPEILRRFKQELILARQITHKNVIRIFDLGQADGIKFITMEYIEGEDLQGLMRRKKKLEPAEAATIMAQVCRALEAAHNEGVVHRDLKPQNIMLDKTGRVYVMDFGIARSLVTPGMTQTGALIGTPDYMSPEQAKGQTLDVRSDLFTVGIIFYEILSGQSPFEADTTMGKLWKRTSEPARPLGRTGQNDSAAAQRYRNHLPADRSQQTVRQRAGNRASHRSLARARRRNARRYSRPGKASFVRKVGGAGHRVGSGGRRLCAALEIYSHDRWSGACSGERADFGFRQ